MGAFDGAEVEEFVGLFLLHKLSTIMSISDYALYRDDRILSIRGSKKSVDDILKRIISIFTNLNLEIDIPPTGASKSVDFLDLNFNLTTGCHAPYRKPLNKPLFIHKQSNHPKSILDEIPRMVSKHLSNNSSNKEILDNPKPPYEEALRLSGYDNVDITFQPKIVFKKPTKKPKDKILFCNLPWNMALKANIGKEFLSLIDMFKNTPQGKFINRHEIKLSYSTMRNLKSHINSSNLKKLNSNKPELVNDPCHCTVKMKICNVL